MKKSTSVCAAQRLQLHLTVLLRLVTSTSMPHACGKMGGPPPSSARGHEACDRLVTENDPFAVISPPGALQTPSSCKATNRLVQRLFPNLPNFPNSVRRTEDTCQFRPCARNMSSLEIGFLESPNSCICAGCAPGALLMGGAAPCPATSAHRRPGVGQGAAAYTLGANVPEVPGI